MEGRNYGLIIEEIKPEDYIFGSGQIVGEILQPDGQWDAFLPTAEYQNLNGIEPYACASFGTNNCIETILRRLYAFEDNYSDRYLAKQTGTDVKRGNSPHVVAEYVRKNGVVDQYSWDFTPDINTFEKFYATPPSVLAVYGQRFLDHYDFKHDYVPNDPTSMKEALKYSPLGMSVYGWRDRGDGVMASGNGSDNHWVMCYGYEEGNHWKIFDSYDNSHKKLEWSHRPVIIKRYSMGLTPKTKSMLDDLVEQVKSLINSISEWLKKNPEPVKPDIPQPSRLDIWARAIQAEESSKPPRPTDVNIRLKNPGNLKYSQYTASLGGKKSSVPGLDGGTFCEFPTYTDGFNALKRFLQDAIDNKLKSYRNTMSLKAFTKVYANPPNDGYAINVAQKLKVTIDTPIKNLV